MKNGVQLLAPQGKNKVIIRLTQEILLAFRFDERVATLAFEVEVLSLWVRLTNYRTLKSLELLKKCV